MPSDRCSTLDRVNTLHTFTTLRRPQRYTAVEYECCWRPVTAFVFSRDLARYEVCRGAKRGADGAKECRFWPLGGERWSGWLWLDDEVEVTLAKDRAIDLDAAESGGVAQHGQLAFDVGRDRNGVRVVAPQDIGTGHGSSDRSGERGEIDRAAGLELAGVHLEVILARILISPSRSVVAISTKLPSSKISSVPSTAE